MQNDPNLINYLVSVSLMEIERNFWENLDISVDDVLELEKTGKSLVTRLSNKLRKTPTWLTVLNDIFNTKCTTLKELLSYIFMKHKNEFYTIFFLAEFAESVNRNSIKNKLPEEIETKYGSKIESGEIHYDALLLPIYRLDKDVITSIWYDYLISKSKLKPYKSVNIIDAQDYLDKLHVEDLDEFFIQLKRDDHIRRNPKVWRYEKGDEKIRIFVRLETKRRSSIHQISKNTFLKKAGDRILIISEKGNRLDVLSKESPAAATWASILMTKAVGKNVIYSYMNQQIETENIKNFISRIRNDEISNIKLVGFERRNVPLANSPTLKLESKSMESLNASLKELENDHGLQVISQIEDIPNITVSIDEKLYKLSLITDNGITTIQFDNRNMPEEEKDKIRDLLSKLIRGE